jgi:hypothetical protein
MTSKVANVFATPMPFGRANLLRSNKLALSFRDLLELRFVELRNLSVNRHDERFARLCSADVIDNVGKAFPSSLR